MVHLETIPGNRNAVFQHLTKPSDMKLHSPGHSSNHSTEDSKHNQPESQGQDMVEHDRNGECEKEDTDEGGGEAHTDKDTQGDEDEEEEQEDTGEEVSGGVTITCSLCDKDFGSRRSLRRHCREVHKQRLEELRKFTETRTVPISLLSVVKERQAHSPGPSGKCCPVCFKSFATKANVRRHFDEVHRGLRRDLITPDISTKTSDLEDLPADPNVLRSLNPKTVSSLPQYNLASCRCLLCKRSYSTQARLKRHMYFVHKIRASKSAVSSSSGGKKLQAAEGADNKHTHKSLKRPREEPKDEKSAVLRKPKLSVGFDFKQLFCKLCKRQFSSHQNLAKHIELHTDNGSDIFIKFYQCPLCNYESRRKRDVLRHVAVVHKKNSSYLTKILPGLDSCAVKKPAETVLSSSLMPDHPKDPDGHQKEDPAPHSPQKVSPSSSVPSVPQNHAVQTPSPPVTRRQSLSLQTPSGTCTQISNGLPTDEEAQDSTEVHVTENFSLHTCDMCGRAFSKKVYLESHKRSHRNAAKTDGRMVGVSTRSKSLLW